jgi:prephenate dehydrogenase
VNTVGIVGVGLIGGSFALALRKAGFTGRIVGVSSAATVEKALALAVIDEALPLSDAAAVSDLIYLAQPISQILETLDAIDEYVRPGTLITDAGSTKAAICERGASKITRGRFIGGHPMAGKESRGVEHADADLFRGRPYVLTARDPELEQWIERIGARLLFLNPKEHDELAAVVSHVPQLISTALAAQIGAAAGASTLAGPAAVDLTRLALSPYDVWRDILATNSVPIRAALKEFGGILEGLGRQLNEPGMEQEFLRAAKAARGLRSVSSGKD